MHAPGVCCEADPEGRAQPYADGDANGHVYQTTDVAGSTEFYVYGGFQAKSREFVDSIKSGTDVTSSPFRDCIATMEVAEKILDQAILRGQ